MKSWSERPFCNALRKIAMPSAEAGAVAPLVYLLGSPSESVQEAAAQALQQITRLPENRVFVAAAGAVVPLVRLLRSASGSVQVAAASALANIANHADNQVAVAAAGAVPPLVRLLDSAHVRACRRRQQLPCATLPSTQTTRSWLQLPALCRRWCGCWARRPQTCNRQQHMHWETLPPTQKTRP